MVRVYRKRWHQPCHTLHEVMCRTNKRKSLWPPFCIEKRLIYSIRYDTHVRQKHDHHWLIPQSPIIPLIQKTVIWWSPSISVSRLTTDTGFQTLPPTTDRMVYSATAIIWWSRAEASIFKNKNELMIYRKFSQGGGSAGKSINQNSDESGTHFCQNDMEVIFDGSETAVHQSWWILAFIFVVKYHNQW